MPFGVNLMRSQGFMYLQSTLLIGFTRSKRWLARHANLRLGNVSSCVGF